MSPEAHADAAAVAADATARLQARDAAHVLPTYGRRDLSFARGAGTALFDHADRPYLDFLTGLAVTSLGHAHPAVTQAVVAQMGRLVHTSNLFLTEPMLGTAERLARITGWHDAKAFFANCGATANEAALKLARRHGKRQHPDKVRVVTLQGSFHGRTMATLEATGQAGKHDPFAPLAGFVDTVAHDDPDALTAAVTDDHCAVLLEVVQGEGGVRPVPDEVLRAARRACDDHGALLVFDEVQTGIGRTGEWFAFQSAPVDPPVVPDVVTVAKALANGLPIGAAVAHGDAAGAFEAGDHATTFGGNPVVCAAANAVIDTIESDGVLDNVRRRSHQLREGIADMVGSHPSVTGVRGRGLLLGVELDQPVATAVQAACEDRFLIVNAVGSDVVRLAPPLTVTDEEVDLALAVLADALTATPST